MTDCKHHFMIPTPNGRETKGICKKCNLSRDMYNSTEYDAWPIHKNRKNDSNK